MEEWRPVPGFPYVEASDHGRVRTVPHWVEAKASAGRPAFGRSVPGGVRKTQFTADGRFIIRGLPGGRRAFVAQLVCRAFNGAAPADKPYALHRNDIATDDRPSNLYWGSRLDNGADARRHGCYPRGSKHFRAKLTDEQAREIKRRKAAGEPTRALEAEFGLTKGYVQDLWSGRTWAWLEDTP